MPAINPIPVLRTCAFRPRQTVLRPSNAVIGVKRPAYRSFADKSSDLPKADEGEVGPNMNQAEHVSEEAAKMANITGGEGPDLTQGTPVQDILKEEKETRKNAPQVMKDEVKQGNNPAKPSTRAFSTLARRQVEVSQNSEASSLDPSMLPSATQQAQYAAELDASSNLPETTHKGHKFPLPDLPLPQGAVKDYRYDPVVMQVTNLLMKDGKKAVAQRNMAVILNVLRTNPAPTYADSRSMLPGAPPASHLPLNPVLYLTLAIDSVAPLLRIRQQKGAAGGGVALQIPVPLGLRQRRRQALMWILDAAMKRKSRGSGNDMFAHKVADELIAVVEGRSAEYDQVELSGWSRYVQGETCPGMFNGRTMRVKSAFFIVLSLPAQIPRRILLPSRSQTKPTTSSVRTLTTVFPSLPIFQKQNSSKRKAMSSPTGSKAGAPTPPNAMEPAKYRFTQTKATRRHYLDKVKLLHRLAMMNFTRAFEQYRALPADLQAERGSLYSQFGGVKDITETTWEPYLRELSREVEDAYTDFEAGNWDLATITAQTVEEMILPVREYIKRLESALKELDPVAKGRRRGSESGEVIEAPRVRRVREAPAAAEAEPGRRQALGKRGREPSPGEREGYTLPPAQKRRDKDHSQTRRESARLASRKGGGLDYGGEISLLLIGEEEIASLSRDEKMTERQDGGHPRHDEEDEEEAEGEEEGNKAVSTKDPQHSKEFTCMATSHVY
ncbi:unnamed protein product [Zymoseptoria tritici ST99CH_1E4]|uniref:Small ribosomal subunit protein uS7 domain-containing protein n=1 Tax=Zymoseptoria tritici ST99CH_1E4 TaxID=1276532 RepID=A0A2H1G4G2_ZYMTR|nr:unnamed protein product [Zymoseptoria tritici ST99CH_1E4]